MGRMFEEKGIAVEAPHAESVEGKPIAQAWYALWGILDKRPKSLIEEVRVFRKYVPVLLNYVQDANKHIKIEQTKNKRLSDIEHDRSNKRWSKEEDELLINLVCDETQNIHQLSSIFGRSPTAIKSRVSELVGVRKLTQEIAGRFIGRIDGEDISGNISGTVYKEGTV